MTDSIVTFLITKYQEYQKHLKEDWGKPSEDCKLLVEMMEVDKIKGLAEFALKINEKQELTHIFYIAKEWKETYDCFNA